MFLIAGGIALATVFAAWNHPRIRALETEIPDLAEQPAVA